jgi:hypothetical protein
MPPTRCLTPPSIPSARILLLTTLVLVSCSRTTSHDEEGLPAPDERASTRITLQELFRTDESVPLTSVIEVDLDSRGNIYIGDFLTPSVAVLSPEGELTRSIGRRGSGPGEFHNVTGVQILPGDSLQVYDVQQRRITVFAPHSDSVAYSFAVGQAGLFASRVARVPGGDQILALFRQTFDTRDNPANDAHRQDVVRLLNLSGAILQDSLVVFPATGDLVLRSGGGVSVTSNPWGRTGLVRLGPNGMVYSVFTDTLGVRISDLSGGTRHAWQAAYSPPLITSAHVQTALERMGPRASRFRHLVEEAASGSWPAVRGFVVDDQGRMWFGLGGPADMPAEWVVFDQRGLYRASIVLPGGTEVLRIVDGKVYAVEHDGLDVPRLTAYRLLNAEELLEPQAAAKSTVSTTLRIR